MRLPAIFLVITFSALFSCNQAPTKLEVKPPIQETTELEPDWLLGKWKRISDDTTSTNYENWILADQSDYLGHGFIMSGIDTIWQERMYLSRKGENWDLKVETPGNDDAVVFTMSLQLDNAFTVENPKHDFPKKISYWMENDTLKASVSGGEREISFEFERLN